MKKKLSVIAAIAIFASVAVYGSLAFFNYEATATNVITTGNVKIVLEEWSKTDDGSLVPFEDIDDVAPGMEASKIVQITNTGGQDAWIRVSVEESMTLAEGVEGDVDLSLISLDWNTEDWTEQDGYYYYVSALKPGETTEPLFTTVTFAETMDNLYQDSKAYIVVDAQATQVANNGSTVLDAAGWPSAE
jgi:hypothetical protein